jgi:hypothetical protein
MAAFVIKRPRLKLVDPLGGCLNLTVGSDNPASGSAGAFNLVLTPEKWTGASTYIFSSILIFTNGETILGKMF